LGIKIKNSCPFMLKNRKRTHIAGFAYADV